MEDKLEALDRSIGRLAASTDRDWIKTQDEVFDTPTLKVLQRLISRGVLATLENLIASGKEAKVFRGKTLRGRNRAVKVYRLNTSTFRKLAPYLEGDPRFRDVGRSHRERVFTWARKEYRNLHAMRAAGARVPRPWVVERNVLVMQYLGWRYRPYPTLRELPAADPARFLRQVLISVKAYHDAGLSHGDLSEYNILNVRETPVLIDVGQAVARGHPLFAELHQRDLRNLHRYFRRLLPDLTLEALAEWSS